MCLHFFFKNIFIVLVLNRDVMLLCLKIKSWNGIHKKWISFLHYLYECFCSHKQRLKMFGSWLPPISPSCLSFYMCRLILVVSSCVESCSESNVFVGKVSYFGVISFTDSKWRLFIFQSIWRLCKMNHDNPMMIGFVGDEMTLKTTLLLCDPIVIVNALVSCVISFEERFWPSITSITIGVIFSTNAKLCCHTNSSLMKHVDALESKCVWVRIIIDLLPLIMMGNKKQGVGSEDKVGPFSTNDAPRFNLTVLIKTGRSCFPSLLALG